jgi:hypothetical protein
VPTRLQRLSRPSGRFGNIARRRPKSDRARTSKLLSVRCWRPSYRPSRCRDSRRRGSCRTSTHQPAFEDWIASTCAIRSGQARHPTETSPGREPNFPAPDIDVTGSRAQAAASGLLAHLREWPAPAWPRTVRHHRKWPKHIKGREIAQRQRWRSTRKRISMHRRVGAVANTAVS